MRLSILSNDRVELRPIIGENYHGNPTLGDPVEIRGRISILENRIPSPDRNEVVRSVTIWSQDETLQNYANWFYDGQVSTGVVHHRDRFGNYNHTVITFG